MTENAQNVFTQIRGWMPTALSTIMLIVWMVNGHNTAEQVSRDLKDLKTTAAAERDKLVVAFKELAVEVKQISVQQAEARAERRALRRAVDRVEARCCGGQ